ncbi:MAG TPA: hypothetical protein DCO83_08400 [Mucilaginibacter sp.]|jgi:hypothetical protein|nr:hypothetical protein [Mucilaginibacter sp.]
MKLDYNKRVGIIIIAILLGLLFAVYILYQPIEASIYNYLPFIFGSGFFLGGLYSFLLSFKIYKPKYKTEEQQVTVDELLKKRGKLWKVGSIFMILYGLYNLIWHDPNMYRLNSRVENSRWTDKDKAKLLKIYITGLSSKDKKHPQLIVDYCTCSVDMIMKKMTRQQYIDDFALPKDEQNNIFVHIVKDCATIYQRRVDSVDKKGE